MNFGQVHELGKGGFTVLIQGQLGDNFGEVIAQEAGAGLGEFNHRWTDAPDHS